MNEKTPLVKNKNNSKVFGYCLAALSIFVWGITFVCTKQLLIYFSALEILFIRFALAYLFLWILYPHKLKISKKERKKSSLFGFGLMIFCLDLDLDLLLFSFHS